MSIFCILSLTVIFGIVLASSTASADNDSVVDEINITVPVACTMSGTGMNTHNAEIGNGQYNSAIGETTLKALCNDNEGFAIYAIGYTDNEEGKNVLTNSTLSSTYDIVTGTATSGNTSNWAMKLSTISSPTPTYPITIQNSFDSFHNVPNDYTLVAKRTSGTDTGTNAEGSTLKSTYQAYISPTQPAGTYTGQVKYTLVHPHTAPAPVPVSQNLYYAITSSANDYTLTISDSDITSGAVASGPVAIDGYEYDYDTWGGPTTPWASYAGEITSVVVSGTVAPTSTSAWFAELMECESWNLSGLKTDHVTDMSHMFYDAGYNATTFTLELSSWNTSSVTDMSIMFGGAGFGATTFTLDLSSWNTSSVTDMFDMFGGAGSSATTWSVGDLSSWDVSNVTDMNNMFNSAGYNATTFTLDLSSWNTSSVTDMSYMFYDAGRSAATWSVTIPKTNDGTASGQISNTTSRLYGKTTSTSAAPSRGRSFTLAE